MRPGGHTPAHAVKHTPASQYESFGQTYAWSNVTYDYAAADTILLVKNTSAVASLHIDKIYIAGDTATEVQIHLTTAATPAGTAVTGVNLDGTSSNVAAAVAKGDETANTQGDIIWHGLIAAAAESMEIDLAGLVVLDEGECVGVDFVTDGGAAFITIIGHYA